MQIISIWAVALATAGAQSLTSQQQLPVAYPELSREVLLQQILPKLKRTLRDPYSIRDLTVCSPRDIKLKDGRPDRWTVFFSFNAKNAFGGYAGLETWIAVFRRGRLSGELIPTQLHETVRLMGLLNRAMQREVEACAPVSDDQLRGLLSGAPVRQ